MARFSTALAALLCLIGLAGCCNTPAETQNNQSIAAAPAPPPQEPPPPVPTAGASEPTRTLATRIAGRETALAPLPTGAVLLVRGNDARNAAFCQAFFQVVPSVQSVAATGDNMVQTFWPALDLVPSPSDARDAATRGQRCDTLLAHYDYDRAQQYLDANRQYLAADAKWKGVQLGPVLLAMAGPDASTQNVMVDMSNVADADFGRVVALWKFAGEHAQTVASIPAVPPPKTIAKPAKAHQTKPAAPACSAEVKKIDAGNVVVTVSVAARNCAGAPAEPASRAPHEHGIDQMLNPSSDHVLAAACEFADIVKEYRPVEAAIAAAAPEIVVTGELLKTAVCKGYVAEAVTALRKHLSS